MDCVLCRKTFLDDSKGKPETTGGNIIQGLLRGREANGDILEVGEGFRYYVESGTDHVHI